MCLLARRGTVPKEKVHFDRLNDLATSASLLPEQISQATEELVDETLSRSESNDCGEPDDQETEPARVISHIQQDLDTAFHKINMLDVN